MKFLEQILSITNEDIHKKITIAGIKIKFKREMQNTEDIQLYSFDIFDTLVTRKVATPQGIFAIMQEKIKDTNLPQFLKDNFYEIRIGAEMLVGKREHRIYKESDMFLADIYEIVQENANLNTEQTNYLIDLELKTEKENMVLLPAFDKLKDLHNQGKRVVLISDMYLSLNQMHYILDDLDPLFKDLKIYVSSEYKKSKHDGLLYEKVHEEENIEYDKWLHSGDNQFSDIKVAKIYGIKTKYNGQIKLEPYQEYLLEKIPHNANLQLLTGAGRLCKLNLPKYNSEKFVFGACFTGPIMYDYVSWVLDNALERGFKTLYFIARDGYIPKLVADIIIEKKHLDIKTKYIYGSRKAWRIPIEYEYESFIELLSQDCRGLLPPRYLCHYLGMSFEDFRDLTGIKNPNKHLSEKDIDKLYDLFTSNTYVKKLILENNKNREKLLLSYFEQELDLTEKDMAFVDVQGSGQTCDLIANILDKIPKYTVHSFYTQCRLMLQKENSKKYCYIPTSKFFVYIELLCRSNEGQTIGYKKENNQIIPIKEDVSNNFSDWGFDEYINGIKSFTYKMAESDNECYVRRMDMLRLYKEYLDKNIDIKTAQILGSIPFRHIGEEVCMREAAPKHYFLKLLINFIFCIETASKDMSLFPKICYARSSKLSQVMQDFMKKVPTLRHLLFNVAYDENTKRYKIRILGINFTTHRIIKKEKSHSNE